VVIVQPRFNFSNEIIILNLELFLIRIRQTLNQVNRMRNTKAKGERELAKELRKAEGGGVGGVMSGVGEKAGV